MSPMKGPVPASWRARWPRYRLWRCAPPDLPAPSHPPAKRLPSSPKQSAAPFAVRWRLPVSIAARGRANLPARRSIHLPVREYRLCPKFPHPKYSHRRDKFRARPTVVRRWRCARRPAKCSRPCPKGSHLPPARQPPPSHSPGRSEAHRHEYEDPSFRLSLSIRAAATHRSGAR